MSLSVAISAFALLISAYTLWATRIRGANLKVQPTGRVHLSKNPNNPGAVQGALMLPLLITNDGANTGYILDVAAKVMKVGADGSAETFRSVYEPLDEEINMTSGLPPARTIPFAGSAIKPGETLLKRAFLVPFEPQSQFTWTEGKYKIVPHTRDQSTRAWRAWEPMDVDVTAESLAAINKTTVQLQPGGGQFVSLSIHMMTTSQTESAIKGLARESEN